MGCQALDGATASMLCAKVTRTLEPVIRIQLLVLVFDLEPVVIDRKMLLVSRHVGKAAAIWAKETFKRLLGTVLVVPNVNLLTWQRLVCVDKTFEKSH